MKNFQPGGLRNRKPDLGGRPQSDVNNYAPKKRFEGNTGGKFGEKKFGDKKFSDKKDITLYKATCTTCGAACEVPFRPDGTKPVLCRDCFSAKNAASTDTYHRDRLTPNEQIGRKPERGFTTTPTRPTRPAPRDNADYAALTKQISGLEAKVNQLLELVKVAPATKVTPKVAVAEVTTATDTDSETPAKVRKPKKVTPAIKKAAVKKKVAVAKKIAKKVAKK